MFWGGWFGEIVFVVEFGVCGGVGDFFLFWWVEF